MMFLFSLYCVDIGDLDALLAFWWYGWYDVMVVGCMRNALSILLISCYKGYVFNAWLLEVHYGMIFVL